MISQTSHKRQLKMKRGTVIAYVLVMMTVVSLIIVSMLGYIVSQLKFSNNRVQRESAFQVAEAGIYYYRWYLAHQVAGKTAQQIKTFWQTGNPLGVASDYVSDWNDPGGGAIGKYSIHVDAPDPDSTIVTVTSTGSTYAMPGVKRVVQARFRRPSWSEYTVIANDFMRFGTGTDVYGKIQSNQGIRFDGVAHNIITSAVPTCISPDSDDYDTPQFGVYTHVAPIDPFPPAAVPNRPDVFQAGRQFPVTTVDFNGLVSDLGYMKGQSQINGQGLYFDTSGAGRHIILKTNGTMDVKLVNSYDKDTFDSRGNLTHKGSNSITSENAAVNYPIPNNGVVFVENNIWVEGSINGKKVTIVGANLLGGAYPSIYIGMNNLTYTNFNGTDIIGLIAQKNIEVIRDSLDTLTIDGALIAQTGRIGRDYYSPWCTSYDKHGNCTNQVNDHKSTITVNGSLATNLRYGFAYTDSTGYTNRILNFDNNLSYYPPPYFPTGTEYSIDLWQEL